MGGYKEGEDKANETCGFVLEDSKTAFHDTR